MVLWSLILAAFLLIGTWVGGYFLSWPLWLKILITVVVVLAVVAILLLRRIRAVIQARRLERDIMKQAEEQAANARPDRRGEILELQRQIQRGIASLRGSKLGQTGSQALYSLPWYILIGPPGAGKTTALKQSGLPFPFLDPQGGGVRGVGGTRNCDWWFTNEGILLDTAGRYTTEHDDQEEWLAFLGFLRKYRPKKPINGVLVAVSVTDLMNANEEEIDTMAKRLRSRVDEVMTRLAMVVPIYIVFTKMDLVAGFVEFFGDLRKSERSQIWGVTFPIGSVQKDATNQFEAEFDLLAQTLHARAVKRLPLERALESRNAIFHFPLEFQSLRTGLADFVGALFQANAFQETPTLRGVYFTSGTQEGSPVDRVIQGMLRAFNIGTTRVQAPPTQQEQKSYFVTDVFRRVVFPDQNMAGRTRGELRRQLINRIAFAASAFLLASILVIPSSCTFVRNRQLLEQAEQVSTEAAKVDWKDSRVNTVDKIKRLDDIRELLMQLRLWRDEGAPLNYRWGMYVGNDIYEGLKGVYVGNLQIGFAAPSKTRLEEELKGMTEGGLTTDQYNQFFNRLKSYLQACDKDRLDVEWESGQMTDTWGRALTSNKGERDVMRPHVTFYFDLMKKGEIDPWHCDLNLVNRVRILLKRISAADRDYSSLIRDANDNVPPITRETIFLNTAFGTYVTSKSSPELIVLGAFTKQGWDLYVRDRLGRDRAKQLAIERWVLGENEGKSIQETEKQLNELRDRYFNNYIRAWGDFMKDFEVRIPQSNEEALDELNALSEVPWPYLRLLKILDENTRLDEGTEEQLERQVKFDLENKVRRDSPTVRYLMEAGVIDAPQRPSRWESPPEKAFRPMTKFGVVPGPQDPNRPPPATSLGHYQERLVAKLVGVLTDLRDSKNVGVDPKTVRKEFENAIRGTNELLNPSQDGFTRPILSPLLLNPLQAAYGGTTISLQGVDGASWEADVWSRWRSKLMDGYPFSDTWRDVKLTDYAEFFRPETGLLFGYYKAHLVDTLEQQGNKFVPTTRFTKTNNYTADFLKCYERGYEISKATFERKGEVPQVDFQINLHSVSDNVSEVTFDINGASHTYKNEPEEWLDVTWPPKDPKAQQSRIKIHGWSALDEEILRPGEWGFFRLLDAASKIEPGTEGGRRGGAPTIVVTWILRSQRGLVKMDIKASREDNAFVSYIERKKRIFLPYNCPRVIAFGVR